MSVRANRPPTRFFRRASLCAAGLLWLALGARAQQMFPLYDFSGGDGQTPACTLVESGGVLYGTTLYGGANGYGNIFSVNEDGSGFKDLYDFSDGEDGAYPYAGLTLVSNTLYGVAQQGGFFDAGTVYSINTNGSGFTTIYMFTGGNDGANPAGTPVILNNMLYGTAITGGSDGFSGALYAVSMDGTFFQTLYDFTNGADGANPAAGLILAGSTLYGTATGGGNSSSGTVFSIAINGTGFTPLHSFGGSGGADPEAGLVLYNNILYGATLNGGSSGNGLIYSLKPNGSNFSALYSFTGGFDGGSPYGQLFAAGGQLYGTASAGALGYGDVFSVSTNGFGFANLYSFTNGADGADPGAGLYFSGSVLYGTTTGDGFSTFGSVFGLSLPVPNPYILNFGYGTPVDITPKPGSQTDPSAAVDPNNSSNLVVASVSSTTNALLITYSSNTTTFTSTFIAGTGSSNLTPAFGEPSVAWDANSNIFLAYEPSNSTGVAIAISTNGGKSFSALTNLGAADVTDQPRIAAGVVNGVTNSVWVVYRDFSIPGSSLVAQGLQTYGTGSNHMSAFTPQELIPGSAFGGFPDIAVGPHNQVMVAYQDNVLNSGAASVWSSVNTNASTTNGFGPSVDVGDDAIGGFTYIPAANEGDGVNASVSLGWDNDPTSIYFDRAYIVYTTAPGGTTSGALNIEIRYSVNDGNEWSAPTQVNDDTANTYSHFFPKLAVDQRTGALAVTWLDCRNDDGNLNGVAVQVPMSTNYFTNIFTTDTIPNDDFMPYGTIGYSGGLSFQPNVSLIPIVTANSASLPNPFPTNAPFPVFTYASDTASANNANGVGHHIGAAFSGGVSYPAWPDNSGAVAGEAAAGGGFNICTTVGTLQTSDVGVTIVENPNPATSQEDIFFYVIVTNYGKANAVNLSITNILGPGLTLVGVTATAGATYTVGGNNQIVIFSLPVLTNNTGVTNLIRATASSTGIATDTASVGSSTPDGKLSNNFYTTNIMVSPEDVGIGMTASTSNVTVGGVVQYFISVTNFGPATNGTVYVTNTLPAEMADPSFFTQSQGGYWITNGYLVFDFGYLGVNQTASASYYALAVSQGSSNQYATNIAQVQSTDFDNNEANNFAQVVITILGEDVGVGISASETNANVGDTITYTVAVTNFGPSSSGDITLTNTLTDNVNMINITQYPQLNSISISGNTISVDIGQLGPGQSTTMIYTAVAISVSATDTNIISTVEVSNSDFDTNFVNNIASVLTTENGEDIALGLTAAPLIAPVGQPVTYTEYVTNLGPSYVGNITVTNTLTTNLGNIMVQQEPGSYTITGNTIVFQVGALAAGQAAPIVFTAIGTSAGGATNLGSSGSDVFDTNLFNNYAEADVTLVPAVALYSNLTITAYASSVFIVWDTPFPMSAQASYGVTTNYGSMTSVTPAVTHHVILLAGLQRDATYYYSVLMNGEGVSGQFAGSFSTSDTLILNTYDANYSGNWVEGSSAISGYYGPYFNTTTTTPFDATASATYSPNIITPGLYNVLVWYPQNANFTSNAQYLVSGATNGVTASVNQTINGGGWRTLTTNMLFNSGTTGAAILYNDTGETGRQVAANAMEFKYVNAQDYPSNGLPPEWWTTFYFGTNAPSAAYYYDYVFGLDPTNAASTFNYTFTFTASNQIMVEFSPVVGGRGYQLQSTGNLTSGPWVTLTNGFSLDTNVDGVFTNGSANGIFSVTPPAGNQAFFRIAADVLAQ